MFRTSGLFFCAFATTSHSSSIFRELSSHLVAPFGHTSSISTTSASKEPQRQTNHASSMANTTRSTVKASAKSVPASIESMASRKNRTPLFFAEPGDVTPRDFREKLFRRTKEGMDPRRTCRYRSRFAWKKREKWERSRMTSAKCLFHRQIGPERTVRPTPPTPSPLEKRTMQDEGRLETNLAHLLIEAVARSGKQS